MIRRIRTRRSLLARLFEYAELSWWPAIVIYAIGAVVLIAAKWNSLLTDYSKTQPTACKRMSRCKRYGIGLGPTGCAHKLP